jgi:ORF6N domain
MSKEIIPVERIAHLIFVFRGQKAMLDSDLATLYGVTTGNLNKAVKRNAQRFPSDFMFQLTAEEADDLIFQTGRSKGRGGHRHRPCAPPEKPRREIGFHVREKAPRYRVRRRA